MVRYSPIQAARFKNRCEAAQFLFESSSRTATPEAAAPLLAHAVIKDEETGMLRFRTPDDFFVCGCTAAGMRSALRNAKRGCDTHVLSAEMRRVQRHALLAAQ